jgi:multiple sugar transport system permease protein
MLSRIRQRGWNLAGLILTVLWILPLWWVIVASLRQPGLAPLMSIEWWPSQPYWGNYREIFQILPLARYSVNSLIVVAVAAPVTLLTASLAGFSMAQLPDAPRRRLLLINVALLMIPAASVWLFRFQILRWLNLLDSLGAIIIPAFAASNPLFVLLFYWAFRSIPAELFEAARLDGADAWTVWRRIAMPLAFPTTACVLVLTFVMYWSDFVNPVLYLHDPANYTLAIGLQIFNQLDATNWPLLMAAAVYMAAPVVLLFVVLQRLFLHDLSPANLWSRN